MADEDEAALATDWNQWTEGDGENQADLLELTLLEINRQLGEEDKNLLVYYAEGIPGISPSIRDESTLIGIKTRLGHRLNRQGEPATFIYHALQALPTGIGLTSDQETAFRPHLITDYGQYPVVDYRMVVAKFLYGLNDDDYTAIVDFVCSVRNFSRNPYTTRCDFASGLFYEGILSTLEDIGLIYKISIVYNKDQLFIDLCNRHKVTLPDVDRQRFKNARGGCRNQLIEEAFNEYIIRRRKHNCSCCRVTQMCLLAGLCIFIIVIVLVAIATGGGIVTHSMAVSRSSTSGTTPIVTNGSVINLKEDGFDDSLQSVVLTLLPNYTAIPPDVYKGDCSKTTRSYRNISTVPNDFKSVSFKRLSFNHVENEPMYGTNGSYIDFYVSAKPDYDALPSNCSLKMLIFTDYESYYNAVIKHNGGDQTFIGSYIESFCLPFNPANQSYQNSAWTYTFNASQSIYAALAVEENILVKRHLTGVIIEYDVGTLAPLQCFRDGSTQCTISLCGELCSNGGRGSNQCIYLQSKGGAGGVATGHYQVSYTTYWPKYSSSFFISGGVTVGLFIVVSVAIIFSCCAWHCCKCYKKKPDDTQDASGLDEEEKTKLV